MKAKPFQTETRVHRSHKIVVDWFYDEIGMEPPWDHEDGHGPVRYLPSREDKFPGERPLGDGWFYNWQEAMFMARRDGWDAAPYGGRSGERAARAVQADYDCLRRFVRGDWHYAGYVVIVTDEEGNEIHEDSLWRIGSDSIPQFTGEAFTETVQWLNKELDASHDYACRC